jgi:hypothetical protein
MLAATFGVGPAGYDPHPTIRIHCLAARTRLTYYQFVS